MTVLAVKAALELALTALSPTLPTAWENVHFTPVAGEAYQRVHLLLADPENMEMSQRWHREYGFIQVTLCYPLGEGAADALRRAEMIRSTFYAGAEFAASGTTVRVEKTPEIGPASTEPDCFVIPVRIRIYAHIHRS